LQGYSAGIDMTDRADNLLLRGNVLARCGNECPGTARPNRRGGAYLGDILVSQVFSKLVGPNG